MNRREAVKAILDDRPELIRLYWENAEFYNWLNVQLQLLEGTITLVAEATDARALRRGEEVSRLAQG